MARVTAQEVRDIIDSDVDPTPFITSANLIVTEELAGNGPTDARLKEIERWLAAHLLAVRDPRVRNTSIGGGTSDGYEGRFHFGTGLGGTQYGQQALALDTTGRLAAMGAKRATLTTI